MWARLLLLPLLNETLPKDDLFVYFGCFFFDFWQMTMLLGMQHVVTVGLWRDGDNDVSAERGMQSLNLKVIKVNLLVMRNSHTSI